MMNDRPRILIVEDEPFYTEVLESLLCNEYETVITMNGQDTLKLLNERPDFDLVLLDIILPDIDGYEICSQLKSNDATKNIPIIFLTAKSDVDDEVRGFNLGAVDYITKPISPPIVKARVRTHVKMYQIFRNSKEIIRLLSS